MSKLPFEPGIFWKVLPTVYVLVVVAWILIVKLSGYVMKPADYGGSFIASSIFAYLVHLWLLPGEYEDEMEDEGEQTEEAPE